MKKRYIAIIAISSNVLLFGSLIFYTISAFPELLLSEEEKQARLENMKDECALESNDTIFEEAEIDFIFDNNASDIAPESYETVEFIVVDAKDVPPFEIQINDEPEMFNIVIETSPIQTNEIIISSTDDVQDDFIEEIKIEEVEIKDEVIVEEINETIDVTDTVSHYKSGYSATILPVEINEEEIVEEEIILERKEMMNNQEGTSNNKILECTLIVIGAVDILSFLLVKKRKRLLRF